MEIWTDMTHSQLQRSQRTAVIVLGMHRSGTSAVAGVLSLLGISAPRHLMAPTPDNPKGYWESTRLMVVHDRILRSAGSNWHDWDKFNPDWIDSPDAPSFAAELEDAIASEFGDSPAILVKDPRVCRLMPLWRQVLARMNIEARVVMPLRKPAEVSSSLRARDGFGAMQGQALWLRHVLEAEAGSRGLARARVTYDALLRDWRGVITKVAKDLGLAWPRMSGQVEAEIDAYLADEFHRNRSDNAVRRTGRIQDDWVQEAYELLTGSPGPEDADVRAQLDAIKRKFDSACHSYMPILREIEGRLEADRSNLKAQVAGFRTELEQVSVAGAQATEEVEKLNSKIEELQQSRNSDLKAHLAAHQQRVSEMNEQIESLREAHDSKVEAQREAHERQLSDLDRQMAQLRESHALELREWQSQLDGERSRSAALEAELRRAVDENAEATRRHASELEAERTTWQRSIDRLHAELAEAKASIRTRFEETKTLTELVLSLEDKVSGLSGREKALEQRLTAAMSRGKVLEGKLTEVVQARELEAASLRAAIEAHRTTIERFNQWGNEVLASTTLKVARTVRGAPREMVVPSLSNTDAMSDMQLLRSSPLFNEAWYLARYPDVARRNVDPIEHYLCHGAAEGRDPGPAFSTRSYLARNPEVAASGQNPLLHYVRHGLQEGRKALSDEGTAKK